MRLVHLLLRLAAGLVLVVGLVLWGAASALAADGATVTIHKAECPTGVGPQIFEKCHANGLGGVGFAIGPDGNEATYVTDENGVIGPVSVPAGSLHIIEDPAVSSQYLGEYVYCRDLTTDTVLFDSDLNGAVGLHGTLRAGANLVCDWYDITPAATGGDTGGTTDGNASGGTTDAGSTAGTTDAAATSGTTDSGATSGTGGATALPATGVGPVSPDDPALPLTLGLLGVLALGSAAWLRKRTA
jgi:hypothetical protein